MSLKLIRRTANGDLQLAGSPLYIAGTVSTFEDLPPIGEAAGECYWVGSKKSKTLYLWNGERWDCPKEGTETDHNTAMDSQTINQTLLQTGFPVIT